MGKVPTRSNQLGRILTPVVGIVEAQSFLYLRSSSAWLAAHVFCRQRKIRIHRSEDSMTWPSSIMRILIPNIADKDLLSLIPALEVSSRQFQ
jgi:hypothetical protein